MYEQKTNTGAIFENEQKQKDNQPDMRGDLNIDGNKYSIAGWWKQGIRGKFLSLSVREWIAPEYEKHVEIKPIRQALSKPVEQQSTDEWLADYGQPRLECKHDRARKFEVDANFEDEIPF